MQVVVAGLLINYLRNGSGKQLVILPGWADTSAGWQGFAAKLAQKYDVIVPDLPGFGGSQAPEAAWGLDEYAHFIAEFIEKLDLKPAAIIGHSNGGAIAIRGLARRDFTVPKLVLIASAGVRGEQIGRKKLLRALTKTGKLLSAPLPANTRRRLRRSVYQAAGSDMLAAEHMSATFQKIVGDDVRADAAKLHLPTLLVYAGQDAQTPVRHGKLLSQLIKNSQLRVIEEAGHFAHQDQPAEVLKLVEDFVG